MLDNKVTITPSANARNMFNRMVNHADDDLFLTVNQALMLGVKLFREGHDPSASAEMTELVSEKWIKPHEAGWLLH